MNLLGEIVQMLKVQNITKKYNNFVLDDVSIEVADGRITGIVGANGAGKSTTFKAILGLIRLDGGNIYINNKNIKDFKDQDRAGIGVVLTDSFFNETLDVNDIAKIMKGTYRSFDRDFFFATCERFKIPKDKKLKTFSHGMKAKIKVITAISYDTHLLVLDEPTIGLDVLVRDEILDLIRDYIAKDEKRSVIISSHNSSDIEKLCDEIYMIDKGKVVLRDDTDSFLSEYAVIKADDELFDTLDKKYMVAFKKENFGYECLVKQRDYYIENYPDAIIEKAGIDEMMIIMIKGERV